MPTNSLSTEGLLRGMVQRVGHWLQAESTTDDWSLWRRATAGDAESARTLVRRLTPQAMALSMQMLGRREAAEDAVQESFLRLWTSQASDTGQARLATYFNTIVLNRCRSQWARQQREVATDPSDLCDPEIADDPGDDVGRPMASPGISDFTRPLDAERLALETALRRLPMRQRLAVSLWAYGDLDVPEIARRLDIEPNAAHQLLHRAKTQLRRWLQTEEVEP